MGDAAATARNTMGNAGAEPLACPPQMRRELPPDALSISVALCTYNGEQHVAAQLESIARQFRLPDQLVIVDDCSTDGTWNLVRQFAERASFPVCVLRNPANLGYAGNFAEAILRCTGDVIVLCDQDDVWLPFKLALVEKSFSAKPAVGMVFTDAEVVGADLAPAGYGLWEAAEFSPRRQQRVRSGEAFPVLLSGNLVTGATLAFRSRYRELVLPMGKQVHHDAWIALLVAAVADVEICSERAVLYRQHGGNEIGIRRWSWWERARRATRRRTSSLERLRQQHVQALERLRGVADARVLTMLEQSIAHLETRVNLPAARSRRLLPIGRELMRGGYARWGRGIPSAVRDLVA